MEALITMYEEKIQHQEKLLEN